MNIRVYTHLFATPVGKLLAAYGLARLPVGINALAIGMVAQQGSGSAALAGLATAAYLCAMGVQALWLGRFVDRRGPRGVIEAFCAVHALALLAFALAASRGMGSAAMLLCAALAGLSMPPVSAIFRSVLRKSELPDELRHAAFALDAVLVELCFIGGPLVASAFAAMGQVVWALGVSALAACAGCAWFVASGGVRLWGQPQAAVANWLGVLRLAAVRHALVVCAAMGMGIGVMEMALTAAAQQLNAAPAVGWMFAALSVTSAISGVLHGSRHWRASTLQQLAWSVGWLALGAVLLAGMGSVLALVLACLVVGFGFAPAFTALHSQLAHVTPAARTTESFTWMGTVLMVGVGLGWAAAGALAQLGSWHWAMGASALLLGIACALAGPRAVRAPAAV